MNRSCFEPGCLEIVRAGHAAPAPTRLVCEAAALLGVSAAEMDVPRSDASTLRLHVAPGGRVLIVGPSGSGKTTLLRGIAASLESHAWTTVADRGERLPDKPCIDLVARARGGARGGGESGTAAVQRAMRLLARAGLGEAGVFARRPGQLSNGQLQRLRLALLLKKAELAERRIERGKDRRAGVALVIDELGTALDDATCRSAAALLDRFIAEHPGMMLVAASARSVLASMFSACTLIGLDSCGRAGVQEFRASAEDHTGVVIEAGDGEDYQRLAPLHYVPGAPATIAQVRRAVCAATGEVAGVLVVSMPTLNAVWRSLAWGGRYAGTDKRKNARRLNEEVRCTSRVIVEPAWRGLGVARRLVRAYLDSPLTPATEALAAMGRAAPFFERAGMTVYPVPRTARDERLLSLVEQAGVPLWRLAQPRGLLERCVQAWGAACVEREVRRWAGASRASRGGGSARGVEELFATTCRLLAARRVAYAAVS